MTREEKLWIALGISILANAFLLWPHKNVQPVGIQVAQVAPPLKKQPTEQVACTTITAYKAPAKAKVPLPASVVADPNQHLIAGSEIAPSERSVTVSTVLNTSTGVSETYMAPAPLPWLALENRGEVALDYGFENNGLTLHTVARLNISEDLVQIKDVHLGLSGAAYSDGHFFAGAGIRYRW